MLNTVPNVWNIWHHAFAIDFSDHLGAQMEVNIHFSALNVDFYRFTLLIYHRFGAFGIPWYILDPLALGFP